MEDNNSEKKVITRAEAIALGLSRYFTGKPCKHGHVAERRIEGKCVECVREDVVENAKIYAERAAVWNRENRDRINENRKIAYHENLEESRAKAREQYAKNPESAKRTVQKWRKENPDAARNLWRNSRALRRGADGKHTKEDVSRMLVRQNHKCNACKISLTDTGFHVDHITPVSKGGSNWPWNLQILCPTCNTSKNAKDFEEWKSTRFK
jgi:5-methylcytosine-specific restriction endonuclease McrA